VFLNRKLPLALVIIGHCAVPKTVKHALHKMLYTCWKMLNADQHFACVVLACKQFKNNSRLCNNREKDPFSTGFLSLKHASVFQIWSFAGL